MALSEMLNKRVRVNLIEGNIVYGVVVEVDEERVCIKLKEEGVEGDPKWINGTRIKEIIM